MNRMQAAAKGGRVVVDEISMMGHKDAYRLVKLAEKLDLKLMLRRRSDAARQRRPRGALMRLLKDYGGIQPFRLTEILRQENAEMPATGRRQRQLSEGKTLEGFDTLDRDGLGHARWPTRPTVTGRSRRITCRRWTKSKTCLVVSPTHDEAGRITHEIRSQLRDAGQARHRPGRLPGWWRPTPAKPNGASGDLPAGRRAAVPPERQRLQERRAGHRDRSGERCRVEFADRFSLYRPEAIALAEGDKIRFTGTVKTLDGKHTLKNGDDQNGRRVHRQTAISTSITAG